MAFRNKQISNPKTGQSILFLQTTKDTNGQLLEMETTYHSFSKEPFAHFHPEQDEDFTVLEGKLTVRIDGQMKEFGPGEILHIPKGKIHAMWNQHNVTTVVNWQVKPALTTEYFLETVMGIATNQKTNDQGTPGILQVALFALKFADVFRLSKPSFIIQKVAFTSLSPFAKAFGYRSVYKQYID